FTISRNAYSHAPEYAHKIANAPVAHQTRVIQITPLLDSNQVGNLWRHEHTRVAPRSHTRRNLFAGSDQFIQRHLLSAPVRIIGQPRHFKLASERTDPLEHFDRIAGLGDP